MTTPAIQAQHVLGRAQAGDYIDWAVDALVSGSDSPNLRILAGLDRFVSSFEAEEHFKKARKELGLPTPSRDRAIKNYALHLACCILDPDSPYETLVAKLSELCYTNDYPAYLMEWYALDDEIPDISTRHYPYGFDKLHQVDPRKVVTEIAKRFITDNSEQGGAGNDAPRRS